MDLRTENYQGGKMAEVSAEAPIGDGDSVGEEPILAGFRSIVSRIAAPTGQGSGLAGPKFRPS